MSIFSRKSEVQEPLLDHTIYLIDTENVRTVWTLLLDRMTENDKIYVFYTANSGNIKYEDLNGVISSGKNVELIQCHTGKNGLDFQLVSYLGYLIRNNENADYCIISDDSGYDAVIKFWEGRDVDVMRKTAAQISGKPARPVKKSIFGVKKTKPAPKPAEKPAPKPAEKPAPKPESKARKQPSESVKQTQEKASAIEKTAPAKQPVQQSAPAGHPAPVGQPAPASGSMEAKVKLLLPDEPDEKITVICDIIRKSGGRKGLADIHDEIEKAYRNEKASDIYRIIRHNISDICS